MSSRTLTVAAFCAALLFTVVALRADKITLTDGTVIDGVAIKQGNRYWVKKSDGSTSMIDAATVKSIARGGA